MQNALCLKTRNQTHAGVLCKVFYQNDKTRIRKADMSSICMLYEEQYHLMHSRERSSSSVLRGAITFQELVLVKVGAEARS